MLKRLLQASLVFGATAVSVSAHAVFIPAAGPTYIKFDNREQFCSDNCITSGGVAEDNWGIALAATVSFGTVVVPGSTIALGLPQFTSGASAQITAMFYGLQQESLVSGVLESKGGFMDLYYDEPGLVGGGTIVNIAGLLPGSRTALDQYAGITDGVFLGRIAFAAGVNPIDALTTITANNSGFPDSLLSGSAMGYGNAVVGATNWQGTTGVWEDVLNTDFFTNIGGTPLAFGTRDVQFRYEFSSLDAWSTGCNPTGEGTCLGASSADPITFSAGIVSNPVPEPGTLSVLGVALLGLGAIRRQRSILTRTSRKTCGSRSSTRD